MAEDIINQKRIRDHAPYRKSLSMTEEDIVRASELERLFNIRFRSEAPFNFSKTISKALELAIMELIKPPAQPPGEQVQNTLTGIPVNQDILKERNLKRERNSELSIKDKKAYTQRLGKPKKYQKKKRGF